MMMELMGLHVPNAAFVNPEHAAAAGADPRGGAPAGRAGGSGKTRPLGQVVDEKAIVNAMVGLLATGGSTNHAIHLPAIARAAGILIDWEDFDELSGAVPLIARVYPNGSARRERLPRTPAAWRSSPRPCSARACSTPTR